MHALCATLIHVGLVQRFKDRSYHLGARVMDFSSAFLARSDVAAEFRRLCDSLGLFPEDTLILSVLHGADVVYIACRNGDRPITVNLRVGLRLPANCVATGKALLSTLPTERIAQLSASGGFRKLTKKSVATLPEILKQLAEIRRRGYSIDNGETQEGHICIGAPVFDAVSKEAIAGVAVAFMQSRMTATKKKMVVEGILKFAAVLSVRLGANRIPILRSA